MGIWIYDTYEKDYSGNGLGRLMPTECTVTEDANGSYELQMSHAVDSTFTREQIPKWQRIRRGVVISAPVPIRTMPEIVSYDGVVQMVTQVERWRAVVNTKVRIMDLPDARAVYLLKAGEDWIVTRKLLGWCKGRAPGGYEGWVQETDLSFVENLTLEDSAAGIEQAVPAAFVREQLFRVYRVQWSLEKVDVYARHITYDLARNLVGDCTLEGATAYRALRQMLSTVYVQGSEFDCYTDIKDREEAVDWTRINPIKALLDPEIGFCDLFDAQLVRDNFTLYLLREAGIDREVKIEYGKNMLGIRWDEDEEEVITRLVPVGEDEDGEPLLLPERYIDSSHVGEYAFVSCDALDVDDAVVNLPEEETDEDETVTQEMAYERMRKAVQAEYDKGVDLPVVTLSIDFLNLGDTEEYKPYRSMQQIYMHDYVRVRHNRLGLFLRLRVIKTVWDAVNLRHTGIELSTKGVDVSGRRIASWQIPKDVEGNKIRASSITATQLATGAIAGSRIKNGSVTSGAIAGGAVEGRHVRDAALGQSKVAGLPEALQELSNRIAALES